MKDIITTQKELDIAVEAKEETIDFLLNFSKSLVITKAKGIPFESNLN